VNIKRNFLLKFGKNCLNNINTIGLIKLELLRDAIINLHNRKIYNIFFTRMYKMHPYLLVAVRRQSRKILNQTSFVPWVLLLYLIGCNQIDSAAF